MIYFTTFIFTLLGVVQLLGRCNIATCGRGTSDAPPGFDNMFFSLYGLSNTSSSMIGPNVFQAIINKSGNNWDGFPFLFLLCTCASLVIWFAVDVPKGRRRKDGGPLCGGLLNSVGQRQALRVPVE